MLNYEIAKTRFTRCCETLELPVPEISPALPTDPCDFTSAKAVRLNVHAAGDDTPIAWYIAHNVGHYILDLYAEEWMNDERSDKLADLLGSLILDSQSSSLRASF